MEEVSSLNECNFKNYDHDDTSIINGLSEFEISKGNKDKTLDSLNSKIKENELNLEDLRKEKEDLKKNNEDLIEKINKLENENKNVKNLIFFYKTKIYI